jgi:hypothetical protein
MLYEYLFAFLIIMIIYSFYSSELNYAYNSAKEATDSKYLTDLSNYYSYHMI